MKQITEFVNNQMKAELSEKRIKQILGNLVGKNKVT